MATWDQPPAYIHEVAPDPSTAQKLRSFAASTPAGLLSQIRAARPDVENFLGPEATRSVVSRLEKIVRVDTTPLERPPGSLGVPMSAAPRALATPKYDIDERNRLWDELQKLRKSHASQDEIERVEHKFNDLVGSH